MNRNGDNPIWEIIIQLVNTMMSSLRGIELPIMEPITTILGKHINKDDEEEFYELVYAPINSVISALQKLKATSTESSKPKSTESPQRSTTKAQSSETPSTSKKKPSRYAVTKYIDKTGQDGDKGVRTGYEHWGGRKKHTRKKRKKKKKSRRKKRK